MGKKEFILDQLEVCRNVGSWIQPLSVALENLRLEDISWRQNDSTHTIGEIVYHLYFYNQRWLRRFKGETPTEVIESNASTFRSMENLTQEGWRDLVERLDENLANWQQAIKEMDESKLYEQIPNFPVDAAWWGALSNLCTHITYHIGQIIYIRKAQGSWVSKEE
ncbi:DinB family protein [Bacillus sp. AFS041924]|uniref:DinB family protein n=1 Tax=Bacillus sp. AFS041924 TaxID=2033503 RepID=UPI000BFC92B0|nr:DinB family protein [Bacillus sp. AFS041924]PGS52407.1 damage-inducible protein DinB [Bacillus sp. AFS041924]